MRAAHPRARGLAREPVGPHHRSRPTTAACGATRGASGGRRCAPPTSCASTPTATIVEGKWDVTPAVFLHTELHRARADATVDRAQPPVLRDVARDDGRAAADRAPELVHLRRRARVRRRVRRRRATPNDGKWLAAQVGDASGILLAHHGAIVTAPTIAEACYKAATFERMCRFTYDILAAGRTPVEIPADAARRS